MDNNILIETERLILRAWKITDIDDLGGKIFDVDVHLIPEDKAKNEPAHYHYDIRFLFIAENKEFKISDESKCIRWLSYKEARTYVNEPSMFRMLDKVSKMF